MRYPLILTRAFFTTIAILLTMTVTSGGDCTPTGTHLSDTFSGTCPDLESHDITNIGKQSHYNIDWPDGHFDGLTATGSGQCAVHVPCGLFRQFGLTVCWPAFYQPQATTTGVFSIFVEHKVGQVEHHDCPDIAPDTRVYCNISGDKPPSKSPIPVRVVEEEDALMAKFLPNVTLDRELILRIVVVWHIQAALVCRVRYS